MKIGLGVVFAACVCWAQTCPDPSAATASKIFVAGQVTDTSGISIVSTVVEATKDTGESLRSTVTDSNGCYNLELDTDKYTLSFWKEGFQQRVISIPAATTRVDVNLDYGRSNGEFYRLILGMQQAGASSSTSTRKLFADMYVETPGWSKNPDLVYGPRLRFFGDVRATSVPEAAPVQLASFNLGSQVSKLDTSQLAQSIAFVAGAEFRIFGHPPSGTPSQVGGNIGVPYVGSNNNASDTGSLGSVQKFTGHFFASFGAVTTFNPQDSATLVNGALTGAQQLYKAVTGTSLVCPTGAACPLALLSQDATRFPKQYYAGIRLKTHYFTPAGIPTRRPPALLDVALGQNALITQGHLHGLVLRMEAFYPLPIQSLQMIYLFGRAELQMTGRNVISNSYILAPDTSNAKLTDPNVQTLNLPFPNRDTYQIGIGMDMLSVVSKLTAKTPAAK